MIKVDVIRVTNSGSAAGDNAFPRQSKEGAPESWSSARPRVSIGLPVYNGGHYLPGAIEAILAQSFTNFELIVCDNASTDQTQAICTAFAARDSRVRYHRNEENIGAAGNFNLAFRLARGELFKWAAHDDLHAPDYLQRCVDALDEHEEAVLAHTGAIVIDADGQPVPVRENGSAGGPDGPEYRREDLYDLERKLDANDPAVRLGEILTRTKWCFEIFGLMRANALSRTPLHLMFYGSDKVLLASMALQGPFCEIAEPLFYRRHHTGQSSSKDSKAQALWMSTRGGGKAQYVPPQLRCMQWYLRLIARSGLSLRDRLHCLRATAGWVVWLMRLIVSQRHERGFLYRVVFQMGK